MKHILVISLLLLANSAMAKCVDEPAKAYMLWKEARNQPIEAQRAVLDVLHHRMLKSRLTACKELMKPSQYPYMKHGVKPVSKEWLEHYRKVRKFPRVLPCTYLFFNHTPHKWGNNTKKIGGLYFSEGIWQKDKQQRISLRKR